MKPLHSDLVSIQRHLFELAGFQIYPYQEGIITDESVEIIVNKSRQIGISYDVASWALINALYADRIELIVSPSQRQSTHVKRYSDIFLNKIKTKHHNISLIEDNKTSLIFESGGAVHSLPNSPSTIRGFPADDIYFDEYAHFLHGTDKECIAAISPSISRGGRIRYISTPFGDQNDFHALWNDKTDRLSKHLINYRECPDITMEMIERQKLILGRSFDEEYENKFLTDQIGVEFPLQLIQSCIDPELEYYPIDEMDAPLLHKNLFYKAGADIGREHDLTAWLALEKRENDIYYLVGKKTMRQTPYEQQQEFFEHVLNQYNFSDFNMDKSGLGDMLVENLENKYPVLGIKFDNEIKQALVLNLKRLMFENKIKIPSDPQLINSIRAIRRIYTPTNYLKFDSDRDSEIGHADLFWALALAVYDEGGGTTAFAIE